MQDFAEEILLLVEIEVLEIEEMIRQKYPQASYIALEPASVRGIKNKYGRSHHLQDALATAGSNPNRTLDS